MTRILPAIKFAEKEKAKSGTQFNKTTQQHERLIFASLRIFFSVLTNVAHTINIFSVEKKKGCGSKKTFFFLISC